jgi:hypothetical protein
MRLRREEHQEGEGEAPVGVSEASRRPTGQGLAAGEGAGVPAQRTTRAGEGVPAQRTNRAGEGAPGAGAGEGVPAGRRRRRGIGWRTRDAGAAAVGAVGTGFLFLARIVMSAAALIALLIVLAIVLRDVNANAANSIVKGIHEGANFFAGSFTDLITFSGHAKRAITVNWGIAAIVYLIVGAVLAGYIRRLGRRGLSVERSRRAALR